MQQECKNRCPYSKTSGYCDDSYRAILKKNQGRLTRERIELLKAVCNYKEHFQAGDIASDLKKSGLSISLTTIYRNFPLMEEAGIIRRTSMYEDRDRGGATYEHIWGHGHHDHLICSRCGLKVEFHYPAIEALQELVAEEYDFKLNNHHFELIGLCGSCREGEETSQGGAT